MLNLDYTPAGEGFCLPDSQPGRCFLITQNKTPWLAGHLLHLCSYSTFQPMILVSVWKLWMFKQIRLVLMEEDQTHWVFGLLLLFLKPEGGFTEGSNSGCSWRSTFISLRHQLGLMLRLWNEAHCMKDLCDYIWTLCFFLKLCLIQGQTILISSIVAFMNHVDLGSIVHLFTTLKYVFYNICIGGSIPLKADLLKLRDGAWFLQFTCYHLDILIEMWLLYEGHLFTLNIHETTRSSETQIRWNWVWLPHAMIYQTIFVLDDSTFVLYELYSWILNMVEMEVGFSLFHWLCISYLV